MTFNTAAISKLFFPSDLKLLSAELAYDPVHLIDSHIGMVDSVFYSKINF